MSYDETTAQLIRENRALAERVEKLERALAAMVRKVEGPVTDWNERHPAVPHPATRALNDAHAVLARPSTPPTDGAATD